MAPLRLCNVIIIYHKPTEMLIVKNSPGLVYQGFARSCLSRIRQALIVKNSPGLDCQEFAKLMLIKNSPRRYNYDRIKQREF